MNKDIISGNWKQLSGEVKRQWGKLTNDHLTEIDGNRIKLIGTIQEQYGITKEEAEKQVDTWEKANCASTECSTQKDSQVA